MRVNVENLTKFLEKVSMNGMINDALLDFGPDGLRVTALDASSTGGVNGLLHREGSFTTDYEEMTVPILSTDRLLKFLKSMDGIVDITLEGNTFRAVGDNAEFSIVVANPKYLKRSLPIDKWPTSEKLGYDNGFELDSKIFENTRKGFAELVVRNVTATLKDGVFRLQVGVAGKGDCIVPKASVEADYEASAEYGPTLLEVTKVVKGIVKVAFKDNYPMMITQNDPISNIQWMASPVLDDE